MTNQLSHKKSPTKEGSNKSLSVEGITDYLLKLANPEIAAHSQGFFKTAKGQYGEGDLFLGIRVPILRQAVKQLQSTSVTTAEQLLSSKYHEVRLFALLLLVTKFTQAKQLSDDRGLTDIYQRYLNNTQFINNWDLVDSSAYHIVGAYLYHSDQAEQTEKKLFELAHSSDLWQRRIAIVAPYHFIKQQQYQYTLQVAEILLNDPHDLIHKAVGWMLREVGKQDKQTEVDFLNKHYRKMPRTMLRYAIEKFSPDERQAYLKGRI